MNHVCTVCVFHIYLPTYDSISEIQTKCVQFPDLLSGHMFAKPVAMVSALAGGDLHLNPVLLTFTTSFVLEAGLPA